MAMRAPLFSAALLLAGLASLGSACSPSEVTPPQIALSYAPAPGTCAEWTGQPVDRSCLPRMARAGVPLELEIEERCGACGSTADKCTVTVEGRTLTMSLDGKTCEPAPGSSCHDVCGRNRVRCKVPALDEGRYMVRYGDPGGRVDSLDVVLRRDAATTCALEDAPPGG
jgi:hypothetical protein